jgi:endonuclease III related protein
VKTRNKNPEAMVRAIYRKLARAWGPQRWWPAESAFEVIVGAILTQNTSWANVERALANLRLANLLDPVALREIPLPELEAAVRPSGYFRQKAQRLKNFVTFLDAEYGGSLEKVFAVPTEQLRSQLLSLNGIGPETADGILLYAGNHEIFVVDAYCRRVLERHEAVKGSAKYDEVRVLVESALAKERKLQPISSRISKTLRPAVHDSSAMSEQPRSPLSQAYNEMHGLFVQLGKHYCYKKNPACESCPLQSLLPPGISSY